MQQLLIFRFFTETKSMTKTAERMNLKQPTVSFHLKKLEESIGVPLYEKNEDDIILTSAGKVMYNYAHEIVSLQEEAERVMKDFQKHKRGELLIGSSHIPGNYVLPPILKSFSEQYPQVHLSLTVKSTPSIVQDIKQKKLDMALVSEQDLEDSELNLTRLMRDPLVLVMKEDHPLAKKEFLAKEDISLYPFIIHSSGSTRKMIDRWCKKHHLRLKIAMEINSLEAIIQTVVLGMGVTIVSSRMISSFLKESNLTYREVPAMSDNRWISLIFRQDIKFTPHRKVFYTLITDNMRYA
ncbi:LysR family transcriptional regulator [Alteribacillus iranensis]|uniref:DNA-binding transcriptional regulator, LysR family n=1 Tax=Alteribacillus iranensis TaxID=930128 RepID=A0A1I2DI01_9BACI|nr:LysR family transcriptional regulator [Alteribacillus iranensis]SFE80272.1 DNA-binding transcriptional regulator, LysR family [Alteribacillus iranensis]